jgi:hypothetical protein
MYRLLASLVLSAICAHCGHSTYINCIFHSLPARKMPSLRPPPWTPHQFHLPIYLQARFLDAGYSSHATDD